MHACVKLRRDYRMLIKVVKYCKNKLQFFLVLSFKKLYYIFLSTRYQTHPLMKFFLHLNASSDVSLSHKHAGKRRDCFIGRKSLAHGLIKLVPRVSADCEFRDSWMLEQIVELVGKAEMH
ncbi:unnamed protein product [Albugo candida]|uniref:Uncharacterized protein n=1 Tax=Albugo candida TaxID=65357 RepID=A0A024FWH2_9STRA|nr:unnamed protein product [Albugo candida]|eukprot:CCI11498.1 unnamed protein product [Albugo candida]